MFAWFQRRSKLRVVQSFDELVETLREGELVEPSSALAVLAERLYVLQETLRATEEEKRGALTGVPLTPKDMFNIMNIGREERDPTIRFAPLPKKRKFQLRGKGSKVLYKAKAKQAVREALGWFPSPEER